MLCAVHHKDRIVRMLGGTGIEMSENLVDHNATDLTTAQLAKLLRLRRLQRLYSASAV
jgi:hypothetical protein